MKILIIIIFLLTFTRSFSQTEKIKLLKNTVQKIEIKYPSGELKEKGKKKLMTKLTSTANGRANGVMTFFKHGKWIEYHKNGNKKRVIIYNKDEIIKVKKEWNEDGSRKK